MVDLEMRINQVWSQGVRPLVADAYRCYAMGSSRACIVLTWTAVCADLIGKLFQLAEDGEGIAKDVVKKIEAAQSNTDRVRAVTTMQEVEGSLLQNALDLELIDDGQKRELERLKDDRNHSAHPSLRPLGELYTPSSEYARAHLVAALDALLVHPPSQGKKACDRFKDHVLDPSFVGSADFIVQAYFDRVKTSTRRGIVDLAAKCAVLELDPGSMDTVVVADRMAVCLRAFAERDREAVKTALAPALGRLKDQPAEVRIRALARLGDLETFWAVVDNAMRAQFRAHIEQIQVPIEMAPLAPADAALLSLVGIPDIRAALPILEKKIAELSPLQKAEMIALRPGRFVSNYLADVLAGARSFRTAETVTQRAVMPCAAYMDLQQLDALLTVWADNEQCRRASQMVELALHLYESTKERLRTEPNWQQPWKKFMDRVRELEPLGNGFDYYRYGHVATAMAKDTETVAG